MFIYGALLQSHICAQKAGDSSSYKLDKFWKRRCSMTASTKRVTNQSYYFRKNKFLFTPITRVISWLKCLISSNESPELFYIQFCMTLLGERYDMLPDYGGCFIIEYMFQYDNTAPKRYYRQTGFKAANCQLNQF